MRRWKKLQPHLTPDNGKKRKREILHKILTPSSPAAFHSSIVYREPSHFRNFQAPTPPLIVVVEVLARSHCFGLDDCCQCLHPAFYTAFHNPRPSFQDTHTLCQSHSVRVIDDVSSCWSLSCHSLQHPESLLWVSFVFLYLTSIVLNASVLVLSYTLGEFLVKYLPSTPVTYDLRLHFLIRYP